MEAIDTVKFLFVSLEPMLMLFALAWAFRIGAIAKALLYMCLVMLGKEFIDISFQQGLLDLYNSASSKPGKMNLVAAWHLFYVASECAFVAASYMLLTIHKVKIRKYIRVLVITAVVRSYLHMAQGIEVVGFTSSHIAPIYEYGLPILDYIMIAALFVGVYQCYQKRLELGERIAWTS